MTFEEARATGEALDNALRALSKQLQAFERGPMGLTPDHVKQSREYKAVDNAYAFTHRAYREFNTWFVPTFEKEYREYRRTKRAALLTASALLS